MIVMGKSILKSWSKTQTVVATSSGEAESYGLAKVGAEAIGMKSRCEDLGVEVKNIELWVDSSAAKAIAGRVGADKLRHVEVAHLWIQDMVQSKKLQVKKIKGTMNPADILTKAKSAKDIEAQMKGLQVEISLRPEDFATAV